eukprot:CCRYP_013272-RA/>CCRYP_013272-RA protein AED:0.03 eAED:0.03 QI:850/1/1/1/0.33/0/4/946/716
MSMAAMHSTHVPSSFDRWVDTRSRVIIEADFIFHRRMTSESNANCHAKPWHDPSFMKGCAPETVEAWLISLLKSNRGDKDQDPKNATNMKGENSIFVNNGIDSTAYLRVLEAYAQSKLGGAPQRAEYWIGRLERHYAHVVKSYIAKYGTDYLDDVGLSEVVVVGDEVPQSPFAKFVSSKSDSDENQRLSRHDKSSGDSGTSPTSSEEFSNPRNTRDKDTSAVKNLQPTVSCYNAVIEAWSNDHDAISVVRSRRWLTKLQQHQQQQQQDSISSPFPKHHPLYYTLEPNAQSYDLYLNSCSRGIGRNAKLLRQRAEEAEDILRFRMSSSLASPCVRPTTESFNYVVRAWTRCRTDLRVAEKVMGWVREMEGIQRDVSQWETKQTETRQHLDEETDWAWKRRIAPNTKTYTMAMDAWIIVAGLKAEQWYSEQRSLDNTYKQLGKSRKGTPMENRERFLDRRNASGGDGSVEMENAASILKYIQALEGVGRDGVHATVVGYNTLLSGWAKLANPMRSEVPLKSEAILRDMMESYENGNGNAAPDVLSFNAVIKAWGKTRRPNSASRCEWWLRKMVKGSNTVNEQEEAASIPKPNVQTYNLVMEAWLQLGDPARVQDLLLEMDVSDSVAPNSESFSKVIRAWLQDEINNQQQYGLSGLSCENAWKWLKELLEREKMGHPDLGSAPELFSSILKTAARTKSRGENLLILGQGTFWVNPLSSF